ncbi:MAG: hypothetical protein AAGH73_01420, partial [Pseudomonadota bacterium]
AAQEAESTCAIPAPENASPLERLVWADICSDGTSNLADHIDGACVETGEAPPPQPAIEDILSEAFVTALVFDLAPPRGVALSCAVIPRLNLSERRLPASLRLTESWLGLLTLTDARIGGTLDLTGSYVAARVEANGMEVARNLTASGLHIEGNLDLWDADIGGYALLRGARVGGDIRAWRLAVAKNLFLSEGTFGAVRLLSARIGGNLSAIGAEVSAPFDADRIQVGGSVFLRGGGGFASVDLLGAAIGGDLSAAGSRFAGPFEADRMAVGGDVFLRDGAAFAAKIDLNGAKIAGQLQLQGGSFAGDVDLSDVNAEALLLWRGADDPAWGPDARLFLRNAETGALQARMETGAGSWTRDDGSPLPADLTGFRYALLGGLGSGAEADLGRIETGKLIAWIRASHAGRTGYNPQPYRALEDALTTMGAEAAATEVTYARFAHRAATRVSAAPADGLVWVRQTLTAFLDRVLQITVGFGVYPQWAFYWFMAVVVAGTVTARAYDIRLPGQEGRAPWGDCFFYSLETAMPLMEPSRDYSEIRLARYVPRMVFHFQKVAGFVLASILLGALTLGR